MALLDDSVCFSQASLQVINQSHLCREARLVKESLSYWHHVW